MTAVATLEERYAAALERELPLIVAQLRAQPGVQRIILFGSYPTGRRDLLTDLDLLVVMESEQDFLTRTVELTRQLDATVALDLLAYTPAEMLRMRQRPFIRQVLETGTVLYEKGVFHFSWGERSETGPSALWPVSDRASPGFSTHLKHTHMRNDPYIEGRRWLEQAQTDLKWARHLLDAGAYYLVCFLAQQTAEKALKALLYAQGESLVLGHSVRQLSQRAAEYFPRLQPHITDWAILDSYTKRTLKIHHRDTENTEKPAQKPQCPPCLRGKMENSMCG